MSPSAAEAVVLGSGIGGLTCGILLARLGYSVTVVEKNRQPGGLMRSYERNGIDCPVGIHYLGALDESQPLRRILVALGVFDSLPLERMGRDGLIDRYVFDDFTFDLPEGLAAFQARLHQQFPSEGRQISGVVDGLREMTRQMTSLSFVFAPDLSTTLGDPRKSLGATLAEQGCSAALRRVLAVPTAWFGVPLDECPAALHYGALASYLSSSWRLSRGGAHMADVLAARLEELGGRLVLGDPVERILLESRAIEGVKLRSGRRLKTPLVIGTVHPKALLSMLPEGAVKPSYESRVSVLEDTRGCVAAQVAVPAASGLAKPYNIFSWRAPYDDHGIVFHQLSETANPDWHLLAMVKSSRLSDWERWADTASGRRGSDYLEAKQGEAEAMLGEAARLFGSMKGTRVLDVYTPLSIRDWVGNPEGSAYGVLRSVAQRYRAALLHRTPVKGLFAAGQSTMAPGVLGTMIGAVRTVAAIADQEELHALLFGHQMNVGSQ